MTGPGEKTQSRYSDLLTEKLAEELALSTTVYLGGTTGVKTHDYYVKTISLLADYALTYIIQVSDNGSDWDPYSTGTLTANVPTNASFTECFFYVRVAITNPDAGAAHTITRARIKGQT